MKNIIKKEKGITMVALVITIIILLILTGTLIYNAKDMIYIKNLTNLYNDIELLREKVAEYYNEYGEIPAKTEYTNINGLKGVLSTNNDTGKFYVVDLEAMNGITLNYGKDYEKVKDDSTNVNNYTDIYIINENSHNIFYVQGINVEENGIITTYYTDYIEPDETTVDLRSVDGILIPDGYYYIGKYKDSSGNESIVISSNKNESINDTSTTQYIWQKQVSKIDKVPDSVNLKDDQDEAEFLKSVNTYQGYFKNKNKTTDIDVVFNIVDEDKWSEAYTKDCEFKDIYGDTVTIPKGFKISMAPTMNVVRNGLVIKDENDNEWVWIPCTIDGANGTLQYKREESKWFIEDDDGSKAIRDELTLLDDDVQYSEIDLSNGVNREIAQEIVNQINAEKTSIKKYGGFYIGRYEVGKENNKAVIQQDKEPYASIKWVDAYNLAKGIESGSNATSYLCSSYAFDTALSFIESKPESSDYGSNTSKYNENWLSKQVVDKNGNVIKEAGVFQRLNTGLTTALCNIYDMGGNVGEFTTELNLNPVLFETLTETVVLRGSIYASNNPAGSRWDTLSSEAYDYYGFRATLFLK